MTPIYHANQMLLIKESSNIPSRPVIDVEYDEAWQCWTYLFPLSLIREREDQLEPTGEPDMDPGEWLTQWIQNRYNRSNNYMNVAEIVADAISQHGADGLCTEDGCGCGLDDLFPCGDGPDQDCCLARRLVIPESGDLIDPKDGATVHHDGNPGDSVFVYL